jgi:hypothetical protein
MKEKMECSPSSSYFIAHTDFLMHVNYISTTSEDRKEEEVGGNVHGFLSDTFHNYHHTRQTLYLLLTEIILICWKNSLLL